MALTDKLTAIGDAIRSKTGETELLTLDAMPAAIQGISGGGENLDEYLVFSGNCNNVFSNGHYDWIIEKYGDRVTTSDITDANCMFENSDVTSIPFELNFDSDISCGVQLMFHACQNLESLPKFNNLNINEISTKYGMFWNCCHLRSIPESLLNSLSSEGATAPTITMFRNAFNNCYNLDEITGMNPKTGRITSNAFQTTFANCFRVKDVTFMVQVDGSPFSLEWGNQTIDLTVDVGVCPPSWSFSNERITDDASYQSYKNHPDSWTSLKEYSRYNRASAVNTINSLPITSGSNTIKFLGESGSLTDAGAINTMTEEEIAVATSRGWSIAYA